MGIYVVPKGKEIKINGMPYTVLQDTTVKGGMEPQFVKYSEGAPLFSSSDSPNVLDQSAAAIDRQSETQSNGGSIASNCYAR